MANTVLIKLLKQLKEKKIFNGVAVSFSVEIDCVRVGESKLTTNIQASLISDLGIQKNEMKIVLINKDIYSVEYKLNTVYIQYITSNIAIDKDFINRASNYTKGVIIVNKYDTFDNNHVQELTKQLNSQFFVYKLDNSVLKSNSNVVVKNFDYTPESYELINDLLSQGRIVIVCIDKYTIYDLITSFTKDIPLAYELNIVHNIIGCYQYYIMPLNKKIINDYLVGVSVLKNDILKGKFTPSTMDIARALFEEEVATSINFNAYDTTSEKLNEILTRAVRLGGSDITLSSGAKPKVRIHKQLKEIEDDVTLTPEILYSYSQIILKTDELKTKYETENQVDAAYTVPKVGRFRTSIYKQKNTTAISLRYIEENAWDVEKAGIPNEIITLFTSNETSNASKARNFKDGLILITGPVNTGKSTTMNAMIDYINKNKLNKIITIEDPIEAMHRSKKSLIEQREIGIDCNSYEDGLIQALRSDPDVISVGEMRTYSAADTLLKAARSGHLTFSTFHTPTVIQTLQSFLQMFPENSRDLVRTMLSESLRMVYCQKLLPKIGGGLVAAQEILLNTENVRAILGNPSAKLQDLNNAMSSGVSEGMKTMDKCIADLYLKGVITLEVALNNAINKKAVQDIINIINARNSNGYQK